MNKSHFLEKYDFPKEWLEFEMLPDDLFEELLRIDNSEIENVNSSSKENDPFEYRYEAFLWWLNKKMTKSQIDALLQLILIDPDKDLRKNIKYLVNKHENCTDDVREKYFDYTEREIPFFTKEKLARILEFPDEWIKWDMYPDELFLEQRKFFKPGDEAGSEHDRNGAFHFWLKRDLNEDQLLLLVKLSYLDPDAILGKDVRENIKSNKNCTKMILKYLSDQEINT